MFEGTDFIISDQFIAWPLFIFFHPDPDSENIAPRVSLCAAVRKVWATYRILLRNITELAVYSLSR
ncbi:unnamed protein product, partial [Dicrocoelium dendriticum]